MMSIEQRLSRSDTVDVENHRNSKDYGVSWSAPHEQRTGERRDRRACCAGTRGAAMWTAKPAFSGVLGGGHSPASTRSKACGSGHIFSSLDRVAGAHQIIQEGAELNPDNPPPGVYTGQNMVMLGDVASVPITADGTISCRRSLHRLDRDGQIYNPTRGYTYTDAMVLHGRWKRARPLWRASERVKEIRRVPHAAWTSRPLKNSRMAAYPAPAWVDDRNPELPAYRWVVLP